MQGISASGHPLAPSLRPVACIVASAACFTVIDTIIKHLSARYSVPLLVWARWGVPALLLVALLGPKMRWGLLRTGNMRLHFVRGAVLMLSSVCSFAALKDLPLPEATGLNYSTPVLVVLLAAAFLHEPITRPRLAFVVAGFMGTLLIAGPGSAMLNAAALLAVGAAMLNAAFQILTRKLAGEELIVLMFYPSLVGAVLMSLAVPFLDCDAVYVRSDILLFAAIGAVGALGHFLFVQAFQQARACTIAPFTYTQLVWSTLAGWLTFGTFPDAWALTGLAVIAASGVAVTCYERWCAGLSPADPRASNARHGIVAISFPGVGVAKTEADAFATRLVQPGWDVAIGSSFAIPDPAGGLKAVIRTD
jgi:drug/metabolite transporter (DMT)-like permease